MREDGASTNTDDNFDDDGLNEIFGEIDISGNEERIGDEEGGSDIDFEGGSLKPVDWIVGEDGKSDWEGVGDFEAVTAISNVDGWDGDADCNSISSNVWDICSLKNSFDICSDVRSGPIDAGICPNFSLVLKIIK